MIALKQAYHVNNEKDILLSINYGFIVKFYHSYKVGNWARTLLSVETIM